MQVKKGEYTLTDDASLYLQERLTAIVADKPKDFGNARYVRNLFEKTVEAQANRLASKTTLTKEELTQITKDDIMWEESDHSVASKPVTLNHQSYQEAKQKAEQAQAVAKEEMAEETVNTEETVSDDKGIEDVITRAYNDYHSYDDGETIEVSYTVYGHDDLDEVSVDVEVKERELEWLTEKDEDGEYLDSEYISENRRGLHKRILRAIREDIEYVQDDDETTIDDDDIEYTITL